MNYPHSGGAKRSEVKWAFPFTFELIIEYIYENNPCTENNVLPYVRTAHSHLHRGTKAHSPGVVHPVSGEASSRAKTLRHIYHTRILLGIPLPSWWQNLAELDPARHAPPILSSGRPLGLMSVVDGRQICLRYGPFRDVGRKLVCTISSSWLQHSSTARTTSILSISCSAQKS